MQSETPGPNGLRSGQFTFDELYLHWFREGKGRFDILLGRQQTRFALRGGIYFKSLDRNDSNRTRISFRHYGVELAEESAKLDRTPKGAARPMTTRRACTII
jgi:hypothetical protein